MTEPDAHFFARFIEYAKKYEAAHPGDPPSMVDRLPPPSPDAAELVRAIIDHYKQRPDPEDL